nr:DUF6310 domain-containing protein [Corallococcus sp. AB045]
MAKQVEKQEWARVEEAFEASGQTQRDFALAHGLRLSTLQECADKIPGNSFPGFNVFINGKHHDALALPRRTLWEVTTDDFEKHSPRSRKFFVSMKLPELQREARRGEARQRVWLRLRHWSAQRSAPDRIEARGPIPPRCHHRLGLNAFRPH